ncbi:MAG: extracellular solute-binding protein [Rhizobiaceae bacterium]
MSGHSRREFLLLGAAAASATLFLGRAFAEIETGVPLHGLSAFGDLKYAPDFKHFDYVNPEARKGGVFNFAPPNWLYNQSVLTFNTLNSFAPRGDAPPRMEMCFDSLMTSALDEPDAIYGLLAEQVTISEDRNSFTFTLRPDARFHDGSPLTAEDVAFSFQLFKEKGHPALLLPLLKMTEAAALDAGTFRIGFDGTQSARTILSVSTFPIVSKASLAERPFEGSAMTPLLGSGPYKVGRVFAGQTIEYERVADYWGKDLAVNVGLNNFDRIRIEFYRERQAGFEAFKKGEVAYRQEFTSRTWATGYDFPAVAEGKVIKREFPGEKRPSMQAHAINQRRARFADPRVREAIALCFDFEWTKRNLFYGSYDRSDSCFERSVYKAEGPPPPDELALIEPFRGQLPDAAFGDAVKQAVSDGSGRDRKLLGQASRLLADAGWKRSGSFVTDANGQRLILEILVQDDVFVRVDSPWVENMRAIGIDASIRMVDSAQYQAREVEFDFDVIAMAASFSATPTREELERFFHSRAAGVQGTRNLPGTADAAVDALIDAVGHATDRATMETAMRALDRVLRARHDWIPSWHSANHRAAYWDMFGFVDPKPDFGFPVEAMWWFDEERARAIGKA